MISRLSLNTSCGTEGSTSLRRVSGGIAFITSGALLMVGLWLGATVYGALSHVTV